MTRQHRATPLLDLGAVGAAVSVREYRARFHKSMRTINPTAFQRAKFDWLFAEGCRYHVEETDDGFEVWDVKVDKIVTTKSSRIQADNFVDAMETEDDLS
jgi:hypothetical protein